MKYLFLDIDGVLNNSKYTRKCYMHNGHKSMSMCNMPFDPKCLKNLQKIYKATGCTIILSSTWRLNETDIAIVNHRLAEYGMKVSDCTNKNPERGDAIWDYLSEHQIIWCDCVSYADFVILDDVEKGLREYHSEKNIVITDYNVGLTRSKAKEAIKKLNIDKTI